MDPYIREYGGGDDRWALSSDSMIFPLWNELCDGHGAEFTFAEFDSYDDAIHKLEAAGKRLKPCEPKSTIPRGIETSPWAQSLWGNSNRRSTTHGT